MVRSLKFIRNGLLRRFLKNERGSVYTFAAVIALPLVGFLGISADSARGYLAHARLQTAVDAATLAATRNLDKDDYVSYLDRYMKSNFPAGYLGTTNLTYTHTRDAKTGKLLVSAKVDLPTAFMHLFGFDTMTISTQAEGTREANRLELAISIDMSGSMGSYIGGVRKIDAARQAAKTLVAALYGDKTSSDATKIGIVPWNGVVNIGVEGQPYSIAKVTQQPVTPFVHPITGVLQSYVWKLPNSPVPLIDPPDPDWKGCVYARFLDDNKSDNDADAIDAYLKTASVGWVGWLPRYEGVTMVQDNNDGVTRVSGDQTTITYPSYTLSKEEKERLAKYEQCINDADSWWERRKCEYYYGGEKKVINPGCEGCTACLKHGITPLTGDRTLIDSRLDALKQPDGVTNLAQGLAWAWRVVTPTAPFTEATPDPSDVPLTRAVVLLSDGAQVAGLGDAYDQNLGRAELNERLKVIAAKMKAQGIVIYAIQFGTQDPNLMALLKTVASSNTAPHYFYAPDAATLTEIFKTIAGSLSQLRLSK